MQADDLLHCYQQVNACFTKEEIERLLSRSDFYSPRPKKGEQTLKDLIAYDTDHYLPDNLLYKNDKCYMHYGIETRNAFLKADLGHYLANLDPSWFIKNGKGKQLLRNIVHKYIPETLMDERKRGFTIPLSLWLKTCFRPYIEKYLNAERLNTHRLLNTDEVLHIKTLFYRHPNIHQAKKIWLLLQFQLWHEKWMDG
ncbi:exosortase A system-associated amidotransferase 1 [compost metagenome]